MAWPRLGLGMKCLHSELVDHFSKTCFKRMWMHTDSNTMFRADFSGTACLHCPNNLKCIPVNEWMCLEPSLYLGWLSDNRPGVHVF